jgi:hypothetical protein
MQSAIRHTVTVKDGGLIEFRSPELAEGTIADVIVLVSTDGDEQPTRLADLIGRARGGFASATDVDDYIRRERDNWHS